MIFKLLPLADGSSTMVDAEGYHGLLAYNWFRCGQYVAGRLAGMKGRRGQVKLHRLIMNAPSGVDVDHINHDPLDNRRSNLRLCTRSQNICNRRMPRGPNTPYRGVSRRQDCKSWRAQIKADGRNIHLGNFHTPEEAARAYDAAARHYYGEFATLNRV